MAWSKDPMGNQKNHHLVLAENGTHHQAWLECEGYWTPKVGADTILGQPNPQFDPQLAQKFRGLMQSESDRIHGIRR